MSAIIKNLLKPSFKHKKLSEDFVSLEQTIGGDGVSFACRELGSTFVTEAQEESTTADAIRRIVHAARVSNLKPRRVTLHISSKGVRVQCAASTEVIFETDIYNVTYCSADAHYNHVFAFITTVDRNAYECHAYLCHSAKAARTVSLAIAQAFSYLAQKYCKDTSEILTAKELREKLSQKEAESIQDEEDEQKFKTESKTNRLTASLDSLSIGSDVSGELGIYTLKSEYEEMKKGSEDLVFDLSHLLKRSSSSVSNGQKKTWAAFDQDPKILPPEKPQSSINRNFDASPTFRNCGPDVLSRHLPTSIPDVQSPRKSLTLTPKQNSFSVSEGATTATTTTTIPEPFEEPQRTSQTKWETFNSSSPFSSFDNLWDYFPSTYQNGNGKSEWASFSD